ncbi:MAG TPA: sugar ABC transporter substrate-binding protein [Chloroflexota bacterium]|nr:sugar ABC transporter substrate-binding protein [Chloroflexota bacterium]
MGARRADVRSRAVVASVPAPASGLRATRRGLGGVAATLAGLGGAALAVGCAPASGTAGAPPAAPSPGPVAIEVLTRAGVANPTGHSQFYAAITPERFTPETGISVTFVDAQPSVAEKLLVLAAGGTLPDASWFGVVADGSGGPDAAANGVFKPLDDLAKRDSRFDARPYFKALLDAFSVGGKLYALPTHGHYGTNVLYYNANLTGATGVVVPQDGSWSVDDLIAAAQKLVRKGDDVWGYFPSTDISEAGVFFLRQFGGELLDESGRRCLLDTPESRAGLEWVANTRARFQVIDDLFRQGGQRALFEAGKLGFFNATPAEVALYKKPGQELIKHELGVALMAHGPGGRRGTQASGSGMGITAAPGTPKHAAAWEWIKFITSKETGIAGVLTGGAGSPGGRTDVWNDPRFLAFDPVYATILKAYPQGAGSMRLPANRQRPELIRVVNEELAELYRGNAGVAEATGKAVQRANAALAA